MCTSLLPKAGTTMLTLSKQTLMDVLASDLMNSQLECSTSHVAASWAIYVNHSGDFSQFGRLFVSCISRSVFRAWHLVSRGA